APDDEVADLGDLVPGTGHPVFRALLHDPRVALDGRAEGAVQTEFGDGSDVQEDGQAIQQDGNADGDEPEAAIAQVTDPAKHALLPSPVVPRWRRCYYPLNPIKLRQ